MSHDRSLHKYYQLIFNKLFFCTVMKGTMFVKSD